MPEVSVPSFGDSFFIPVGEEEGFKDVMYSVSVPSFGDSFFIVGEEEGFKDVMYSFPSPHSGILFLCGYRETLHL